MVLIINISPKNIKENTASEILKRAQELHVKRLVIDSLSALSINTPTTYSSVADLTEISIQRFMYLFIDDIREYNTGITALLITQAIKGQLSRDTISEFICDGIINIAYDALGGKYSRSLTIQKMRETKHDEDVHPLEISDKGITIHKYKD